MKGYYGMLENGAFSLAEKWFKKLLLTRILKSSSQDGINHTAYKSAKRADQNKGPLRRCGGHNATVHEIDHWQVKAQANNGASEQTED